MKTAVKTAASRKNSPNISGMVLRSLIAPGMANSEPADIRYYSRQLHDRKAVSGNVSERPSQQNLRLMAEKTAREAAQKNIAENRKAFHDYHVLETFEAGVALLGTEVKSIREGRVNLRDSYAQVKDGEVFVHNVHIQPYSHRGYADHEPMRARKLLLHAPRNPQADRQDHRARHDARAAAHVLQERARQGGAGAGEGQAGARQARRDQEARGRSRNARGGEGARR